MSFSKELKVAIEAAKAAGEIQLKYYKKAPKTEMKADNTPLTIADKESDAKIISILKKEFPSYSFLTEETGEIEGDKENVWIVDPIDGTKNFVAEFPLFGSSIGLQRNGEIVLGVINLPAMGDLAYAEKGKGAFSNNQQIHVSKTTDLKKAFVIPGDFIYFKKEVLDRLLPVILNSYYARSYSDLAGYLLVAKGKADLHVDPAPKAWDLAAAKIIVEEAGGKFTDFEGKATIRSGNCIASNGLLHETILKIIKGEN